MNLPGWALAPAERRYGRALGSPGSIKIWRLIFSFEGTDAVLVDYRDYH